MAERETTNVNIELPQEDFEFLRDYKDEMGLTWEGLLKTGTPFPEWKKNQYTTDE
ncbi:hypothetical protein JCM18237_08840 [Halorubrum luteum]